MYSLVSHLNIFPIASNVNLSCGGGHLGFLIGIKNLWFSFYPIFKMIFLWCGKNMQRKVGTEQLSFCHLLVLFFVFFVDKLNIYEFEQKS
jgi:hypothetical protein